MQISNEAVSLDVWANNRDHPVAFYRHQLEAHGRLHFDGKRWLVADYELIEQIVADEAHFSAGPVRAWPAHTPDPLLRIVEQQALFYNGAEHRRVQALMHAPLSRLVQSRSHLLDYLQHTVTCLLDAVQQTGEMDAVRDFAAPLSLLVMARALGIPTDRDDHLFEVMEASDTFADVTSGSIQGNGQAEHIFALKDYLHELVAEKRIHPAQDLISAFIASEHSDDPQRHFRTEEEMVVTIMMLLAAGRVTMRKVIGEGLRLLLRDPDHFAQVRTALQAEPALITVFVEQLLCSVTPTSYIARWAKEDVPIDGKVIGAGQKVILFLEAGNLLAVCEHADPRTSLDVRHPLKRPHLAFGPPKDPHFCVGAALARKELRYAFAALLRRFPNLRLKPGGVPTVHPNVNIGGLTSLCVCWGAGPVLRGGGEG